MSDSVESNTKHIVCEIVERPEDIPAVVELFRLAGKMTHQEVDVYLTNDPGEAGKATFSQAYDAQLIKQPFALELNRTGLIGPETYDKVIKAIAAVEEAIPYTAAGYALLSTALGATAIFVDVDDPEAFRYELDAFIELSGPQQSM
jgi:hypothetical protein